MSSIVTRRSPNTTAPISFRSLAAISASLRTRPEIEKIEPLVRRLHAKVFETQGIALRPGAQMLRAFAPRQVDAARERLEIQPVTRALAQAEKEVDGASQRMR